MRFARGLWRVLVGVKDALVLLLLLLFFGGLYAALSLTPHAGGPIDGALALRIDGPIVEQPADIDPLALATGGGAPRAYRLAELIHALDTAAGDAGVRAVALDLDVFAGGRLTALSDIGDAIDRVRRSGKRVVAYASAYTDDTYQLAAHADEVWMSPMGGVLIAGPGGANLYYAQLLQRLGITANIYRVGDYKSAVEPYIRSDMSPEARQNSEALAGALWNGWREEVRRVRPGARVDLYVADTAAAIGRFGGDMGEAARRFGFVDRLGDRGQFNARMAELVGAGETEGSYRAVPYASLLARAPLPTSGDIGILTVAGNIVDGEAGGGTAGAETVVQALEQGMRDHRLRALVVRIDSGGGSVLASERIRAAVQAVRNRGLPVITSMGSVAASGGYWIAASSDRIFAEPTTITGSIGVFGVLPSFEGALRQLGVGVDGVRTTPLSGEPNILGGPSDAADRLLQTSVEGTYRRFIHLVSRARRLPPDRVNEIAGGRVWDGGTARQLGLVDQFGSLQDAVAEAARRAELDPERARAVYLAPEDGWFSRWFGSMARAAVPAATAPRDPFAAVGRQPRAMIGQVVADAEALVNGATIQARCLECGTAGGAAAPPVEALSLWHLLLARPR